MKWSWKIAQVSGIGIYIHATFLLLVAFVAVAHLGQDSTGAAALSGILFIVALFFFVVLHELGHAFAARRFGIRTRDITLLPIGGVARLERMPDEPRQELWVALAGPLVSLASAAALFVALWLQASFVPVEQLSIGRGSFIERLMVVNLFLALFNLLPAFPMDGGRALRALLATRLEYTRATQVAASIGQAMALAFGLIGLFTNPFLVFIALFVWIGASGEASMVQMKSALGGIPVSRAMITDFRTIEPDDRLERAIDLILAGSQQDFPVVDRGRIVGVLTRADLMAALARQGQQGLVRDTMRREFQTIDASEMLDTVSSILQSCGCHTLPVLSRGELVGLVTPDNIGEFLMIRSALESAARQAGRVPAAPIG